MVTIVQRAKHIVVKRACLGDGIVVFLSHWTTRNELEQVASKVLKARLWDGWKRSVMDSGYTVLCILQQSHERLAEVQATFSQKYDCKNVHVAPPQSSVAFVNDGPCTLVFS